MPKAAIAHQIDTFERAPRDIVLPIDRAGSIGFGPLESLVSAEGIRPLQG